MAQAAASEVGVTVAPTASVERSAGTMSRRFLTTLVFSWLANPLGVLIAHALGVAQNGVLIMVLLASSTCSPYQIFLNESVAARRASRRHGANVYQLAALIIGQSITCIAALVTLPRHPATPINAVVVAGALGCTAVLTYLTSIRYYALTLDGRVSSRDAATVGLLPGLTSICLYVLASTVANISAAAADVIIYSISVLPTAAVFFYVAKVSPDFELSPPAAGAPTLSTGVAVAVVLAITLLTLAGSRLRDTVSAFRNEYAALILVALNSMASLLTTLTRTAFLGASQVRPLPAIMLGSVLIAVAGVTLLHAAEVLAYIFLLISIQGLIIAMLEVARRAR